MFRSKNLLSDLIATCRNHLKNKAGTSGCITYIETPRNFYSGQIFSTNLINKNGFTKFLSVKKLILKVNESDYSKTSHAKCWKCSQYLELKNFTCASCGALQYPKQFINFFELFGISQSYDIDLEDLSKKFKNLQMNFHPDKFVNKTKEEMEISEMYSRIINKAYSVLKDPSKRGFYILELFKVSLDISQPLEKDFLASIMEKNEELESINSEHLLLKFSVSNNREIEQLIENISKAFSSNRLNDAKVYLHKLNYFVNLDLKIKEKQNGFLTNKK